jgi:hypothetical protein
MLTELGKPDKINLGYRIFFEGVRRIVIWCSNFKIYPIILLILLFVFISINTAHAGWSTPVRIWPGGGEWPQIVAQGDTLHVAYVYSDWRLRVAYQRSPDAGLTWNAPHIISSDTIDNVFPRIVASGNRIMVLWKNGLSGYYRYTVAYNISSNNGVSWSNQRYVLNPGTPAALQFAASGGTAQNVNIGYYTYIIDTVVFYSIRSTNFGQSWSASQEIFRTLQAGIPGMASYGSFVHLIWDGCYQLADPWEVYYLRSIDGGISWSQSVMVSTRDSYGSEIPHIYVDSHNLSLCWLDGKYSPYMVTGDILGRTSSDSGLTWGFEWQASYDHFAWGSDVASSGDTIHIVWNDEGMGIVHRSIYYARSTDNGESWSEPYWIDGTLDDSYDPAIAVSNGRVYIVWTDGRANPDSNIIGGLYFSRWDPENSAINGQDNNNLPNEINLSAYPNPFNSSVTITYSNLKCGVIGIYDIQGKLIRTFNTKGGDNGKIIWDAYDALGNKVSSGEYFIKAGASQNSSGLKLLYLK